MKFKSSIAYCFLTFLAISGINNSLCRAADATGPTPFPKEESAWPGKGPVRIFGWMVDNRKFFWSKRGECQGAVVFAGDSLTGNWTDIAKAFPKLKVANRGIGGDVSRGLLFRFQEDVLDLHPKAIVIDIGNNDLTARGKAADALSNITAMLDMAAKLEPAPPVILCTVSLSADAKAPVDPAVRKQLNDGIAALAGSKPNVTLLDLCSLLAKPDGTFDPQYFKPDQLHLDTPGYAKWAGALEPIFEKLKLE